MSPINMYKKLIPPSVVLSNYIGYIMSIPRGI